MSSELLLLSLRSRHAALQEQLIRMQVQHDTLHVLHSKQCLSLIEESMKGLFEVIVCVRKADKNLVDWHHRSDGLKLALRCVGLDRRTTAVIDKKTKKLKAKVSVVEGKFDKANDVVTLGLRATENLKSEFVDFSRYSVDQVSKDTINVQNDLNRSHGSIESQIEQQRKAQSTAQERVRATSMSLAKARNDQQTAEGARGLLAAGSIFGFGVAAISAVVCPPTLLLTGSALVAGASAGALACVANEDANDLEAQQGHLTASLSLHESSIESLKAELLGLDQRRGECADAIMLIETLQAKTGRFRANVQDNLNHIRNAKLCLDKTRLKLADIIRKLHECQYEETRRCIATRLREVLTMIQATPKKLMMGVDSREIQKAMQYLTDIDDKTVEVLRISRIASLT